MARVSEFVTVHSGAEEPGVATLLVSRAPTNAMTRQVYREIAAAAAEVSERDDIAAVVLYGGHEIFCAGDDVPELRTLIATEAEVFARVRHDAVQAVAAIGKPTVAAITGYALGSGLALALAADWRVCGDNVKFGATEILAGLVPDGGGLARLAGTIGASRAKELAYSGRFFDAEEALALGLVEQMVAPDGVYEAAMAWARQFVGAPARALAAVKASVDAVGAPMERALADQRRYAEVFGAGNSPGEDQRATPES
ncbi:enoyl-CoA hydratase [Mycolicibacter engbaekii]|uniref:Enoyl-CoA hydratase n=1 Tax=Mycolicibacter engbaekii TaxID=188915 RepID=A0A1X1T4X2_9MYCO|nr:enoyl-CoA hydratase [Mycolicibacter engbaekii]ORV39575.1 enoyl-CoA hydratase [Mycolicibacter engbaekii]